MPPGSSGPSQQRPTKAMLEAARNAEVPDIIAPGLDVLFCGINPSLYSAAVGHHFARPGNRFWPALHHAGFTPRQLRPQEEARLLDHRLGITNLAARATASAAELSAAELRRGAAAQACALPTTGAGSARHHCLPHRLRRPQSPARAAARAHRRRAGMGAAQSERAERALPAAGAGSGLRRAAGSAGFRFCRRAPRSVGNICSGRVARLRRL